MARSKGREDAHRHKGNKGPGKRPREVYVFAEGEVTEEDYIELVHEHGVREDAARVITVDYRTRKSPTKVRKPLPLVQTAIPVLERAERVAKQAGLKADKSWNWPQVWVLFDRDDHKDIPRAFSLAKRTGVRVAYSHPCFELWRLLHYKNHTGSLGRDAGKRLADTLKQQPGFARSYGPTIDRVSDQLAKEVRLGQLEGRYKQARKYAQQLNSQHSGQDQTTWDPYTNVWRFVEEALDVTDY